MDSNFKWEFKPVCNKDMPVRQHWWWMPEWIEAGEDAPAISKRGYQLCLFQATRYLKIT